MLGGEVMEKFIITSGKKQEFYIKAEYEPTVNEMPGTLYGIPGILYTLTANSNTYIKST